MAGVSMKSIKTRIKSMQSTRQITKAMELVAASKLRSTQAAAVATRPYFNALYSAMLDIADCGSHLDSVYLQEKHTGRPVYVVISGDRGLAGGYNSSVLKLALSQMEDTDCEVLPIGKKTVEFFRRRGPKLMTQDYETAAQVTIGDCYSMAAVLAKGFAGGTYSSVSIVYTNFASMLSQTPAVLPLLPLQIQETKPGNRRSAMLYEGGAEAVFNAIVPEYLGGVIYGALCESLASEQAARRTAMDAATKNADEMIGTLNLRYNQARQSAITQEITEIVAGAENG